MIGKAGVIMVLGFASILGYISMNMTRMATNSVGNMSSYNEATTSHELAVAGANVGLARFYSDTTIFPNFSQNLTGHFRGSFTVSLVPIDSKTLRLRSVSSYVTAAPHSQTLHDTVEVYFDRQRQQSFSMYAWMTNFEGNVFWVTTDTVWGRVHSNGALHVNGQPVFMGKATTSKAFDPKIGKGTNNAIFKNGYEQGVPTIEYPTDFDQIIEGSKDPTGRQYDYDVYVELKPGTSADGDGKAYVHKTSWTGTIMDSISINDPTSFNGALYTTGTAHVKGVLDGKMTICSQTNMYVDDDVTYEQRPSSSTSNDLLGLVAENDIYISDNAANNNNCEIDGCLFTRTGSLIAENYNGRPVSGELRINGSIVQDNRGAVGTFAGSTITHGFSKRYRYDNRLSDPNFRPPFYPGFYAKVYAINNWWESFRLPDINPE